MIEYYSHIIRYTDFYKHIAFLKLIGMMFYSFLQSKISFNFRKFMHSLGDSMTRAKEIFRDSNWTTASKEICPAAFDSGLGGASQCKDIGLSCWVIPSGLCENDLNRGFKLRSSACLHCIVYQISRSKEAEQQS